MMQTEIINFSIRIEFLSILHKLDRNDNVGIKGFERSRKIVGLELMIIGSGAYPSDFT